MYHCVCIPCSCRIDSEVHSDDSHCATHHHESVHGIVLNKLIYFLHCLFIFVTQSSLDERKKVGRNMLKNICF